MSMNLLAVQDQITAKLNELAQDVYETSAPEDSKLNFDSSGNMLPFIVVQYSDMYPTGVNGSILSAKYDVAQAYVLVSCVATQERAARQIADLVRDKLTGFQPDDAGELRFAGGSIEYSEPYTKSGTYSADVSFILNVNTAW